MKKTAKRSLAALLAVLMALGMFAAGASALTIEAGNWFLSEEDIRLFDDVIADDCDDDCDPLCDDCLKRWALLNEFYSTFWDIFYARERANRHFYYLLETIDYLSMQSNAFRSDKTFFALQNAINNVFSDAWNALFGSLFEIVDRGYDALSADLRAGRLTAELMAIANAYFTTLRRTIAIADEYLLTETMNFARAFAYNRMLDFAVMNSDLTLAQHFALLEVLERAQERIIGETDIDQMVRDGDWAALADLYTRLNDATRSAMRSAGVPVPANEFGGISMIFSTRWRSTLLNWLLFFLAFGYVWMWF
jgi:hypothetical protein